jgi:hypothetical protein
MKKILYVLTAAALLTFAAACGKKDDDGGVVDPNEPTSAVNNPVTAPAGQADGADNGGAEVSDPASTGTNGGTETEKTKPDDKTPDDAAKETNAAASSGDTPANQPASVAKAKPAAKQPTLENSYFGSGAVDLDGSANANKHRVSDIGVDLD